MSEAEFAAYCDTMRNTLLPTISVQVNLSRDEDPTFFSSDPDPAGKKNADPDPVEKKRIRIRP